MFWLHTKDMACKTGQLELCCSEIPACLCFVLSVCRGEGGSLPVHFPLREKGYIWDDCDREKWDYNTNVMPTNTGGEDTVPRSMSVQRSHMKKGGKREKWHARERWPEDQRKPWEYIRQCHALKRWEVGIRLNSGFRKTYHLCYLIFIPCETLETHSLLECFCLFKTNSEKSVWLWGFSSKILWLNQNPCLTEHRGQENLNESSSNLPKKMWI